MNRDVLRFAIAVLLMLPLASAQAPGPQQASLAVGQVTISALKGEVSVKSPTGLAVAASRGQELLPGSVVETGKGSTVLNLLDGSQVQIKPHSRVTLTDPAGDKHFSLELFLGNLLAKIKKKTGSTPSFRMGTPTAVITVRGTEFVVEVDKKGKTDVYVYDGIVEVAGLGLNVRPVLIYPGFRTNVPPNAAPDTPRQFGPNQSPERDDDKPNRQRTSNDDNSGRRSSSDSQDRQKQQQQSRPGERDD